MNNTVEKMKKANASVPFFIAVLALTLGSLVSFVTATTLPTALYQLAQNATNGHAAWVEMEQILVPALNALPASLLLEAALTLLVLLGLWMHYFSCRKSGTDVATFGLGIVKLVTVLRAIVVVVGFVALGGLVFFVCMATFAVLSEMGEAQNIYLILAVVGGVLLAAVIVVMLYYRGIIRTIKTIRMTLSTGVIMGKVSGYVIVVNYVLAGCALVGALLSPVIAGLISGILIAIGLVFLSIALQGLRSEMTYIARRGGDQAAQIEKTV